MLHPLYIVKYRKVPKFSDSRQLCCNLSKIKEKRPNIWVFRQKDANGIENSEDPVEQSDLGLHCLPRLICPKTWIIMVIIKKY